jgi:NAD(P)-dependent dehydrogenase (short-subunit alcohol dehydrogenase family)
MTKEKAILEGKTIVITGGGSGLGYAWTEGFLAAGARVFVADINPEGIETLAAKGAVPIVADVADRKAVGEMVSRAVEETGRIDVLFNNAGLGFRCRIEDLEEEQFERHVAVHLFGTVSGMKFAIPHMRKQGYGRIINTISRASEFADPIKSAYAAAKAAIWCTTRSVALEVADTDILINMLIPGPTNTAIFRRDMPHLQKAEVTFPTARMLATLPTGGPAGKVFWNEKEYHMFARENQRAAK